MKTEPCLVFYLGDKEIGAYTIRGASSGEREATAELLAYEHNVPVSLIRYQIEVRRTGC